MKNKNIGKIGEKLFKVFIMIVISILCLAMVYTAIKWTRDYFTKTDEQICQISNSTLINGQCHYESNFLVKDRRNMLLVGGIGLPIFSILLIFYAVILLKTKFNRK